MDFNYRNVSARLEEIIRSIDRPGDFCTRGRISRPMPKLEVEDVGRLSFPVPEPQVRKLVEAADQAPYGKGSHTLVDLSVRNCLEIKAALEMIPGAGRK